jgi:SRSO17 transposase
MKTPTPELSPGVLGRLAEYAATFASHFPQARPALWAGVYLQGLLLDGERKSIEPLSRRVTLPDELAVKDPDQALQQFVNQSPWDHRNVLKRYRSLLAETFASPDGIFLVDDVSFPKQGRHSVGVQRQYCGALGKKANCQVAVSVHYVSPKGHYPLDLRLYLPECWLADEQRLDKAGVPQEERRLLTKPQIALELLDGVRGEGLAAQAVVADAGYGVCGDFRDGLEARGLSYIVGVTGDFVVFTAEPRWQAPQPSGRGGGRPRTRPRLAEGSPQPIALSELAKQVKWRRVTWREGTKGKLSGLAGPRLADGAVRRQRAGLAADRRASRRPVQVRLQQFARGDRDKEGGQAVEESLAGGAGLPADEGGAGSGSLRGPVVARLPPPRGFGDAGLRLPAVGAPSRGTSGSPGGSHAGKKGGRQPALTLPAIRRALQHLLLPVAKPDCPYCRSHLNLPLVA